MALLIAQVLYLCGRQGLIGRQMFAIDGFKLPSNASKAKSGTRADLASDLRGQPSNQNPYRLFPA